MRKENKKMELMANGSVKKTLLTLAIPSMIGMVVSALYNLVDTIFVGMLHDTNAMAAVSVSFPFFVTLMALGLLIGVGAAIATAISQGISTVLMILFYARKKSQIKLNFITIFKPTSNDKEIVKQIFSVGIPIFVSQFLAAVAFTILNSAASVFGAAALAAMGIVNKIYTIVTQIVGGFNNTYLPFASFNVGAKRYDRVKEATYFSLFITSAYSIVATIIICIIPEVFIKLFSNDPEVISLGVNALKMQNYLLIGYSFIFIMTSTFQAMKETTKAGILSFARQGVLLIPLTFILPRIFANSVPSILELLGSNPMAPGLYGVMFAQPLADLLTMILCGIFSIATFKRLNKLSKESIQETKVKESIPV